MSRGAAIVWALLTIFGLVSRRVVLAEAPTIVGGEPVVHIDAADNSGGVWIRLLNDTNEDMELMLHVGDFVNQTTKYKVSADVALQLSGSDTKGPFLKHPLPKGSLALVRLTISHFLEAGQANADLRDGDTKLATVRAVKFNVPFNVSLQSADPSHPELVLERGTTGRLKLTNADPMQYRVSWRLWLPSPHDVFDELMETDIAGRSTKPVEFKLPDGAFKFGFSDLVRAREVEGDLELRFAPVGDVLPATLPRKTIPVKVKMQYWNSGWQNLVSWAITLFLLSLGGLCSVVLSLVLPNKLRRVQLIRRLGKVAEKHQRMSSNIDSSLRVGAAVEVLGLSDRIESVALFNANARTTLADYGARIDLLERRVGLIQELDRVTKMLGKRRAMAENEPATILDDVKKRVEEATDILKLSTAEKDEILRAQTEIQGAEKRLVEIMNPDPNLARKLADSVKDLKQSFAAPTSGTDKFKDLRPKLRVLFSLFDTGNKDYTDDSVIRPHHYHWLSSTIERLYVLRHYVRVRENADADRQKRIDDHEEELFGHLRIRTWNSVHHARRLRLQIEEDIFDENVQEALQSEAFSINSLPIRPRPHRPVRLAVRFHDDKLNTCTARKEFTCVWDFGRDGEEEGWKVARYFRNESEAKFTVSFRNPDGSPVTNKGDTDELKKMESVDLKPADDDPDRKQWRIEFAYLAAALLVAILGLIAGARAELMKLDVFSGLVAVFLLGFGADTVKNLISRRPQDEG